MSSEPRPKRRREIVNEKYLTTDEIQKFANEERERLSDVFEVRKTENMGWGLFAKRNIVKRENLTIVYWGTLVDSSQYSDDTEYLMDSYDPNIEIDASNINSLAKYMNHSNRPNMGALKLRSVIQQNCPTFVNDGLSCDVFPRFRLTKDIKEGEQAFIDYGPQYNYNKYFTKKLGQVRRKRNRSLSQKRKSAVRSRRLRMSRKRSRRNKRKL